MLEGLGIASIFLRIGSGHSNQVHIEHTPFKPMVFKDRYLVRGTNEKTWHRSAPADLCQAALFALDHCLTTMTDALRPESACIIIGTPACLEGLDPVITENKYVLTSHTVPYSRFVGVWSLVDCAWIDPPNPGELAKMTNFKSDVDISMHIAHQQFYWEKRNQNEADGIVWAKTDYIRFVTEKLTDQNIIQNFLNSFKTARTDISARPPRDGPTPNDRSRGPLRTREDDRVDQIRQTIAERFKQGMRKEVKSETRRENKKREATGRRQIEISSSESESSSHMAKPVRPIVAKAMPTKGGETWRRKSDKPETSAAASGSSASASKLFLEIVRTS